MPQNFYISDIYRGRVSDRGCVNTPMSYLDVERFMDHSDRAIIPIIGDYMEHAGIVDGGFVAVDFTRFPAPRRYKSKGGDACICYGVYPAKQRFRSIMCMEYLCTYQSAPMAGTSYGLSMVGTSYDLTKQRRKTNNVNFMNCCFYVDRIFGVVFASWDADGKLLWARDPSSFPEQLRPTHSSTGGSVGAVALLEARIGGAVT